MMTKLIIYKDYDLVEELQKCGGVSRSTWEEECREIRRRLEEMISIIEKSVEVMIEK